MYDNNLLETNTSLGNLDDTIRKYSLSSELSKLKKKHMNLNSLIHIYSHKAQFDIDHSKKKSYSTNTQTFYYTDIEAPSAMFLTTNNNIKTKSRYPIINNKFNPNLQKNIRKNSEESKKVDRNYYSLENKKFSNVNSLMYSPEKRKNTHEKLIEFKERENLKKALNAQELKQKNKVLKENIIIYRAKTLNENIQKKILVETKMKIQKNSIENYQTLKKMNINRMISNDLKKEIKQINKKEMELLFWKTEYEKRLFVKEKNKSCNIRNIMLN